MNNKALVLSSGGLDSSVCVGLAVDMFGSENVSTVSVFYGQKHDKELKCAEEIANHYGVGHYVLNLSEIFKFSNCSLLKSSDKDVPDGEYADQIDTAENGMVSTYVPFRNGLMLSAVASLAGSIYPDDNVDIFIGAHADDSAGSAYADCSEEFTQAMRLAISIGTYKQVTVVAPFVNMTKAEVVAIGHSLNVPFEKTWSCYKGGDKACGTCGTCLDRLKAFRLNNLEDPIEYEEF